MFLLLLKIGIFIKNFMITTKGSKALSHLSTLHFSLFIIKNQCFSHPPDNHSSDVRQSFDEWVWIKHGGSFTALQYVHECVI